MNFIDLFVSVFNRNLLIKTKNNIKNLVKLKNKISFFFIKKIHIFINCKYINSNLLKDRLFS